MELSLSGTGFAPRKTRGPLYVSGTEPVVNAEEAWELMSAKFASKFKSVREAFIRCDLDCDGRVSDMEFRAVLDMLGLQMQDTEYAKLWKRFDTSGDGRIDYYEFNNRVGYLIHPVQTTNILEGRKETPRMKPWRAKKLAKAIKKKLANLRDVFDEVDMNKSGTVNHAEFIQMLRKLGFTKVGHEESYSMMTAHKDPGNTSGEMSYEEFERTMRHFMDIPDHVEEVEEDNEPTVDLIHAERILADKLYGKFAAVQRAFRTFDKDHSGELDANEFREALKSLGVNLSSADLKDLMSQYDSSGDGNISYDEFNAKVGPLLHPSAVNKSKIYKEMEEVAGAQEDALHYRTPSTNLRADTRSLSARARHVAPALGLSEAEATLAQVLYGKFSQVRSAFRMFDEDKSGELSASEFTNALEHLGIRVKDSVVDELVAKYDHNGDGHVSYAEFAARIGPLIQPSEENYRKLGFADEEEKAAEEAGGDKASEAGGGGGGGGGARPPQPMRSLAAPPAASEEGKTEEGKEEEKEKAASSHSHSRVPSAQGAGASSQKQRVPTLDLDKDEVGSVRSYISRASRASAASRASRRSNAAGSAVRSVRASTGIAKRAPGANNDDAAASQMTGSVDLEVVEQKMRRILGRSWTKVYHDMRKKEASKSTSVMPTHRFRDVMAERGVPLTSKEVHALSKRYPTPSHGDPDAHEVDYAALMRATFSRK